jgi:AraC family transcriptional regulator
VGRAELSCAFRRHCGETIGAHLRRCRVERVCERLIAEPERSLADLAAEAGFADQSHLTRVFRRLVGTTPGAFQAALRRRPPAQRSGSRI